MPRAVPGTVRQAYDRPLIDAGTRSRLWRLLGLQRLHWTRVVAILAVAPLIGVAIVKLPLLHLLPGIIWIAIGLVVSYWAGPGVGVLALSEILAV